jgi:hypothetical protein
MKTMGEYEMSRERGLEEAKKSIRYTFSCVELSPSEFYQLVKEFSCRVRRFDGPEDRNKFIEFYKNLEELSRP